MDSFYNGLPEVFWPPYTTFLFSVQDFCKVWLAFGESRVARNVSAHLWR